MVDILSGSNVDDRVITSACLKIENEEDGSLLNFEFFIGTIYSSGIFFFYWVDRIHAVLENSIHNGRVLIVKSYPPHFAQALFF